MENECTGNMEANIQFTYIFNPLGEPFIAQILS